jgi:CysZ protein
MTDPAPLVPVPVREPGFVAGVAAFFSGIAFIVTSPRVWVFAMVPIVLWLGITAGFAGLAISLVLPKISLWIGATTWVGLVGAWLLKALAVLLALMLAALLGFAFAQPLSGPALNRIVTAVESKLGAPAWPATSLLDDMAKGLKSVGVASLFGLPILLVLFLVNFFFPPAAVVTFPLKVLTVAILIAWDLCDYPLSLRGLPIGARIAFMKRHLGAMLGFGAGLSLISLIPGAVLLVLPAGVAGAARLTVLLERWESAHGQRESARPPAPQLPP